MDPNTQRPGFNPDQNPFEEIINRGGGMPQPQPAPQAQPSIQGQPTPQGQPEMEMEDDNNPMLSGKTGDSSKPLLQAINALHTYIAMSTDIRTQNMVRNLIAMLTQLVSKDQQMGAQKAEAIMSKGQQPLPTPPQA